MAQLSMDEFSKRQDRLKIIIVNYDQKIEEITRYRDGVRDDVNSKPMLQVLRNSTGSVGLESGG
jgi:hypothetical protein